MNELPGQHWPDREPATGEREGTGRSRPRRVPRHAAAPELGTDSPRHEPIPDHAAAGSRTPDNAADAIQAPAWAAGHPPAGGAAEPPAGNPAWSRAKYLSRFPLWQAAAGVAVAALIASAIAMIAQGGTTTSTRPAATRATAAAAGSTSHPGNVMQPVISRKAAQQVLARYTKVNNQANWSRDDALLSTIEAGSSYVMDTGAYRMQRVTDPANHDYAAFGPERATFYIPRQPPASWPHFFVVKVAYADLASPQHATGTGYLLFTQASHGARWKEILEPDLFAGAGQSAPVAIDAQGYAQRVILAGNTSGLSAPLSQIQPDTIRWLDDSAAADTDPANAGHLADLRDAQFWRRQMPSGTVTDKHFPGPGPAFALRTADGGAIIFYSLSARLELTPPPGDTFRVDIPGYYSPAQTLSSAVTGYAEQFAAADPPRGYGGPRVVADISSIATSG